MRYAFKVRVSSRAKSILIQLLLAVLCLTLSAQFAYPQSESLDDVLDIFDNSCAFAGCHSGPNSPKGLDLSEDFAVSSLVNRASSGKPDILRVKPGDPVNSYLIMKLKGSGGIDGDRMPKGGQALSAFEIGVIEAWIKSLPPAMKAEAPEREYTEAFPGMSLATLPTAETLETGVFSYRIAHRWRGAVKDGFDDFFGLDAGARMYTQLTFPISRDLLFNVGRSAENATFELGAKWRFLREKSDGSVPLSAAIYAGVDWATIKEILDPSDPGSGQFLGRTNGERLHWFAQVPLTKKISQRLSVLVVPGILLNGNVNDADEDAIVTIGLAGKVLLAKDFSLFVEGVPIVSGELGANTVGGPRPSGNEVVINDAFTIGLERKVGGHVFHVYVTNSLGLTTNQYMSGGNFDFTDGEFRLGFNIYRVLRFPF